MSVGYISELEKGIEFYGFYNKRGQKNCDGDTISTCPGTHTINQKISLLGVLCIIETCSLCVHCHIF